MTETPDSSPNPSPAGLLVESEIGRLRRVLVHSPGREIDRMVPSMMEQLLFDDILDGRQARREHDGFCQVLRQAGVETLDPQDLLAEIAATPEGRARILGDLEHHCGVRDSVLSSLADLDSTLLAERLVGGIRDLDRAEGSDRRWVFDLPPLPNYFFQRDPQFVVGNQVVISSMATSARVREPMLARIMFEQHARFSGECPVFDLAPERQVTPDQREHFPGPTLEGGDVLVPRADTLLVGVSERTNRRGVERLAEALRSQSTSFKHMILVELPHRRSFMHLDTVFTFIDQSMCLAHVPVIAPGGPESAHVYHVDLGTPELTFTLCSSLLEALAEIGMKLEAIPCGGSDDRIAQEREQWTDGANAFALAPGVIFLYRRNRRTTQELKRRGWTILSDQEVLNDKIDLLNMGKVVVAFDGNELSRARGGPRCMTMPLYRDPVTS